MEPNSEFVGADEEARWAPGVTADCGGVGVNVHSTPSPSFFPNSTTGLNSAFRRRCTACCGCSGGARGCDYLERSR